MANKEYVKVEDVESGNPRVMELKIKHSYSENIKAGLVQGAAVVVGTVAATAAISYIANKLGYELPLGK